MNIFAVDYDPELSARFLCDKHVIKMTLETAQILCTVGFTLTGHSIYYRPTHINHPCVQWAKKTRSNYLWLWNHGIALADEYSLRYNKIHASKSIIKGAEIWLDKVPEGVLTKFCLAVPDEYKKDDPVESYRSYYIACKKFATWRFPSKPPYWYVRSNQ